MRNPDREIQLSLNPTRGFGLLVWGELLEHNGEPLVFATELEAHRIRRDNVESYLRPEVRVVRVAVHPGNDHQAATYEIG